MLRVLELLAFAATFSNVNVPSAPPRPGVMLPAKLALAPIWVPLPVSALYVTVAGEVTEIVEVVVSAVRKLKATVVDRGDSSVITPLPDAPRLTVETCGARAASTVGSTMFDVGSTAPVTIRRFRLAGVVKFNVPAKTPALAARASVGALMVTVAVAVPLKYPRFNGPPLVRSTAGPIRGEAEVMMRLQVRPPVAVVEMVTLPALLLVKGEEVTRLPVLTPLAA